MPAVSLAALTAAFLFVSFHIPGLPTSKGKPGRLVGIGYHVLLLPVIAALPAPEWVKMAGFGWMLIDTALNGAVMVGLDETVSDPIRQGVHILSAVYVAGAGWAGGIGLTIVGALLAIVFLARTWLSGTTVEVGPWLKHLNAVLNVAWMVAMAIALGA